MKVGRELDALVAEKVMGYERWTCADYSHKQSVLFRPGTKMAHWTRVGNEIPLDPNGGHMMPHYSADIGHAWMVVDRIREIVAYQKLTQAYSFQLCQTGRPGDWFCSFVINEGDFSTQASADDVATAPHAICLAALKAVGHK